MSQLERANFVTEIDQDYIDGNDSEGSYLAARDTSTVQYKYRMQLTRSRLPPMMKICARKLTSAIYCITWSSFHFNRPRL